MSSHFKFTVRAGEKGFLTNTFRRNFLALGFFRPIFRIFPAFILLSLLAISAPAADANRLTYLDESNPFHAGLPFPKLTTPQWFGEPGVEAVVILAVDDMRAPEPYETLLRPILERLKQIDGRVPISIMSVAPKPDDPQYSRWLAEGLSLESHTLTHPCPLLAKTNFAAAAETFFSSISLMNQIPGNHPVAFRMPCCDSMNSASPRFFAELFNQTNSAGQFLTIDSSVMNFFTADDSSLPREFVKDADGRDKFRKYLPSPSFTTTIENYPYPYVINRLTWEFPPTAPSDWEAFHLHGATNPLTVADWKSALDAIVLKQGTFTMVFHPHGWIRSDQMVDLVDYAAKKYGAKIKFLNFREAQQRLDKNLLAGEPLRAANGQDSGVRLLDLNNDGFMDVIIGNEHALKTRLWDPKQNTWTETSFPTPLVTVDAAGSRHDAGIRFGVISADGLPIALVRNDATNGAWRFDGAQWIADPTLLHGLELDSQPVYTSRNHHDRGVRLRDINHDGICELIVGNESQNAVFGWSAEEKRWRKLPYSLPAGASIVDANGTDNSLRFVDINEDGFDDVLFSNAKQFSLHLFIPEPVLGWSVGWSREVSSGLRGAPGEIPMIVRGGPHPDNGAWFHDHTLWVQNEDTAQLKDVVDRRTFKELLAGQLTPPKSPAESLAAMRARPGFKVELVASEPLVESPIAFDWGTDGKLWVVEMVDYPLGMDGKGKPGGIIKFLEDTKGDGHYDKATIFLEGLSFPNGLIPWRKGLLVSAPPEVFYAEDTDGDGRADTHVTLFTGFVEGNQQHRANGFDYGLDNWLYGANGGSAGRIRSIITGKVVAISGRDFRLRPDDGAFETQAGLAQYGRHRDDWGNWFGNHNSSGSWHYFLPEQYLARNPYISTKSTKQVMPDYSDPLRVYPISRLAQRFNDPGTANHLTSANSTMPYRDDLFGPDFAASYFVSEPVHNLVHREMMEPDGVSFTSHRAPDESQSEFLASADNWFRPTMTKTGPDGALYVADMYRLVIEHPEWIPEDFQKSVDLRAGEKMGRIYRVYPANATLRKIPRLDKLSPAQLAAALESPNGWQRDTAQRLIVEAGGKSAVAPLEKLVTGSPHPKARLQALCTLDGLHALRPEIAILALKDAHPAVREHAIRVSESLVDKSGKLDQALLSLVNDSAIRVLYQLAFSLGERPTPEAGRALAQIALNSPDDERMRLAVLSSANHHLGPMLATALEHRREPAAEKLIEQLTGMAAAFDDESALANALHAITARTDAHFELWQIAALGGLLDALDRKRTSLAEFQSKAKPDLKSPLTQLDGLFAGARALAIDKNAPEHDRVAAIRLLGRGPSMQTEDFQELGSLLGPQNSQSLQSAALERLGQGRGTPVADTFIANWKSASPAARARILELLLSRPEWVQSLLSALETAKIAPGVLGTPQQQKLLNHSDQTIRERAQKLFASADADRDAILKRYQIVTDLKGDAARGAGLFRQNCTPCHRLHNEGNELGPDLGSVADKPAAYLMIAILDPSRSFEARYTGYSVVTKNDQEYSGLITTETANSITLRLAGGTDVVILRAELKELTSSGRSLMPDGFENSLNPQAMADLIAYLTTSPPASR
jgi:putative membrane-bound dehydrogenase-like protein